MENEKNKEKEKSVPMVNSLFLISYLGQLRKYFKCLSLSNTQRVHKDKDDR